MKQELVRKARGFTLLELLVVIVIIGLLAAFVAPKYFGQIGRSKVQITKAQIESFEKALDQYRIDTGHYPNATPGLIDLYVQPSNEPNWHGPYLKKGVPKDPWGNAYVYKMPGSDGREYEISSAGESGSAEGTAAIRSWD
ncbi:type II secretion system major pseudopilin GspG [Pseudoduganella sp. FT55W]|uniref:Type II secretion system core protein G n=1 Tax=Duganella rivi TaxID=2666083 RepID=A0A7X4GS91_9BURK|nr:type II secretion system major pseudopilin GspG [Duganella rivi]MYM67697.1 type II secretion system major pseudopilin GspG [Duganella rivi]